MIKIPARRSLQAMGTAVVIGASVIGMAPLAQAKVVCSAGTWGGNHGWGDCTENSVPGLRKWQLKTIDHALR